MDIQFPLKQIDENKDKTAEHWFNYYSVKINKTGNDKIPLLNKDCVQKSELVRFRGIISNQLNNEYFNKICQFRELDDVKQPEIVNNNDLFKCKMVNDNQNKDIMQRFPMILRTEPNQTQWNKYKLFGKENDTENQPQNKAIIAKFYCHTKSLKICDSVEIYGVWCPKKPENDINESDHKENKEKKENKMNDYNDLYSIPANGYDKLPTIHVLFWKKIDCHNPLFSIPSNTNITKQELEKKYNFYFENASLIRSSLIKYISNNYTSSDDLMAEYILLNMISRIVSNKNGVLIGNFPLNIRGSFNNYRIRELYQELKPYSLNINLTIKYLNAKRFVPVKNNETDELQIGILQFGDNTSCVIDETLLNEGKLDKIGLLNIEALKTLINEQKVFYDFEYHSIPFNTNCSVIILSKTRPLPQLRTHCFLYAQCNDNQQQLNEEEDEFTLDQYRIYLSLCSYLMNQFTLNSKSVIKGIEDDFVDIRKTDNKANEDTLHHRLLMMRLINSSFLNKTNDDDMMNILKYMQMLENKRSKRNDKFKPKVATKNDKSTPLNTISEE